MKTTALYHTCSAVLVSVVFAGSAHAGYLCDDPPSAVDKRACEAAEQGPDALRRFIERIKPVHNLYFYDYVNEARLVAWQEAEARAMADKTAKAVSAERR